MDTPPPPRPPHAPHPASQPEQVVPSEQYSSAELDSLRRLRVLEERFVNLRHKAQLADEKVLAAESRLRTELKTMTEDLVSLRGRVTEMENKLGALGSNLSHAASTHDLLALEKYVSYWNPMQFVTREEMTRKQTFLKEHQGRAAKDHGHRHAS